MSTKAESNKKWAAEHRDEIKDYNKAYYAAKAQALKEKRKAKYQSDPTYRQAAIERARKRRAELAKKKTEEAKQTGETQSAESGQPKKRRSKKQKVETQPQ